MKLSKWSLGGVEHDRRRQCTGRVENHALILLVCGSKYEIGLGWWNESGGGQLALVGNWRGSQCVICVEILFMGCLRLLQAWSGGMKAEEEVVG